MLKQNREKMKQITVSVSVSLQVTVYVLAMVGHLKNVSTTFAQMPDRIPNVEFTTVSPTIANTMLAIRRSPFFISHLYF